MMADMHINKKGWQTKWETWEDDIIKKYYPKNGYEKVLEFIPNRNKSGIQGRASKLGIKFLDYNKNFFENIDSEEKAYWLGFIYADGYVTTEDRWGLELGIIDINHMQNLLDSFDCNINIKTRIKNENESCSFLIKNKKMYNDLVEKGVIRNKTELLEFPNEEILPEIYYSHFIRGFFDGDGCVTYTISDYIRKDRNNKIYNNIRKSISFVCKSENFILKLKYIMSEFYDINFNLSINKKDNLHTLQVGNSNDIIKFYNLIYNNSNKYNRLKRKFDKFQKLICHLQ
jgi:hypothetical protein